MEEIKCIFCKNSDSRVFLEENGYTGRKCSRCGLIYVSPRPKLSDINLIYTHDKANIKAKTHIASSISRFNRLHVSHSLKIIKKYINKGALLEIGCGGGGFLFAAHKCGFEPFGIELNPQQVHSIREYGIQCEDKPLNANSFQKKMFDIVYHCNVLSHFYDPIADFKQVYDHLNDGGFHVFETGNFGDVKEKYFGIIKDTEKFQFPDHLYFFGQDNIKTLLDLTGFKLHKAFRYSRIPEKYVQHGLRKWPLRYPFTFQNLHYFLTYQLGYLLPKEGIPQTVIYVAQK